ncbi:MULTISPECIES: hypothetical protein [Pseudanabaena]|uniref:Uncharacterized protein n=2 Tax=Pseudanabaena TaxID=1152 RepID=L8MW48_9CYAN|nr:MULTISPECIES: hypothetical protein [Pseudanabaena]ELS30228.1 hypothetical protein Pse7429DRAFT_4666 [Pseudanabaena biceps PCC 7429]MDG3497485.1 hypothetical protein [Pseudanabaena catenata USMAC16]
MITLSNLRIAAMVVALTAGIAVFGYPYWSNQTSASNHLGDAKIKNNPIDASSIPSSIPNVSSLPAKYNPPQTSGVGIAINQNGNIRRADTRGYINVAIRETYKIEIQSPSYTSAVSVKIDGVSIIDGLICNRAVTLERPQAIAKQFIVLEEGNPGLDRSGGINNPDLGLIEVTFKPIRRRNEIAQENNISKARPPAATAPEAASKDQVASRSEAVSGSPVGTGLSGSSSQEFVATNEWVEVPELAPTYTKKYRLVGFNSSDPITLHNMNTPKPLVDPTPPRL